MATLRLLALVGIGIVGVTVSGACTSNTPSACEGDDAIHTEACAKQLDDACAAHGEDESCERELSIDVGDGVVRCGLARGVVFSDVASCTVDRIAYTCFAFLDTSQEGDSACTYDQCAPDGDDPRTYLTPIERDALLIRRPCGPSNQTMQGPILDANGPVATCSPAGAAPPALCACSDLACEQLR